MTYTVDKVLITSGLVVYYVDNMSIGELVKGHLVQETPMGSSLDSIRALNDKIFAHETHAANYKSYVAHKRVKLHQQKFHRGLGYNPEKEI